MDATSVTEAALQTWRPRLIAAVVIGFFLMLIGALRNCR